MSEYLDLIHAIMDYDKNFRHPGRPEFEFGGWYDLYPEKGDSDSLVHARWPDKWPHNERAGVYAFMDEHLEILYIGKASMKNTIGARLGKYVTYALDKSCELLNKSLWKGEPRYVVIFAAPKTTPFEAASLEEYLIDCLRPPNNTNGISTC